MNEPKASIVDFATRRPMVNACGVQAESPKQPQPIGSLLPFVPPDAPRWRFRTAQQFEKELEKALKNACRAKTALATLEGTSLRKARQVLGLHPI
ncbi:MAG: hypothetical protein H6922_05485 [Pseudomonadaceae bacterium]|nr:hypothetical protein [Pseudomonadaceae bacterium]